MMRGVSKIGVQILQHPQALCFREALAAHLQRNHPIFIGCESRADVLETHVRLSVLKSYTRSIAHTFPLKGLRSTMNPAHVPNSVLEQYKIHIDQLWLEVVILEFVFAALFQLRKVTDFLI